MHVCNFETVITNSGHDAAVKQQYYFNSSTVSSFVTISAVEVYFAYETT